MKRRRRSATRRGALGDSRTRRRRASQWMSTSIPPLCTITHVASRGGPSRARRISLPAQQGRVDARRRPLPPLERVAATRHLSVPEPFGDLRHRHGGTKQSHDESRRTSCVVGPLRNAGVLMSRETAGPCVTSPVLVGLVSHGRSTFRKNSSSVLLEPVTNHLRLAGRRRRSSSRSTTPGARPDRRRRGRIAIRAAGRKVTT